MPEPTFNLTSHMGYRDAPVLVITTENIELDPDGAPICLIFLDDEVLYENVEKKED